MLVYDELDPLIQTIDIQSHVTNACHEPLHRPHLLHQIVSPEVFPQPELDLVPFQSKFPFLGVF